MSASTSETATPGSATPGATQRFDRKFIEDHGLLERYLDGRLPVKGARELETWCRQNPDYLSGLKLPERTQASLKLLEACARPLDLSEPRIAWWRSPYLLAGLAALAFLSLVAFWVLYGKYFALQNRLQEARTLATQGSLVQPASVTSTTIVPDRTPEQGRARIVLRRAEPQLLDVHIDMAYTQSGMGGSPANAQASAKKLTTFRIVVDKKDQGRALILNNLLKDSNNELRLTLNSTGLAAGLYTVRIEDIPFAGTPYPVGWLSMEVR